MVETRTGTIVVRSNLPAPMANASAFGAGIGQAMQQVGNVTSGVALKYIDEADKQAQKDAVNRGMEWESEYEKLRREVVNSGILPRKGKQALGSTSEWEKTADEWYQGKIKETSNDYERSVLNNMYMRRNSATLDTLTRFEAGEKERYFDENTTSRVQNSLDDALANYTDANLVDQAYNSGLAAIKVNYAGRGEILDDKIKEYKDKFYNNQILKRAEINPDEAESYFENNKSNLSEMLKLELPSKLNTIKEHQRIKTEKEVKKQAMFCTYGDAQACNSLLEKAQGGKMSFAEIDAAIPETAGFNIKNLAYKMQGYKTGVTKLDDVEKVEFKQRVYEKIGEVTGNKEAKIEDFKAMQDLIYEGMDKNAINFKEGTTLLNNISAPLMEKWKRKIEKYSDNAWFEEDLGVNGLNEWLEKNYLIEDKIITKETKDNKAKSNAANARTKSKAYSLYFQYLEDVVKSRPDVKNVADVLDLPENQRKEILGTAQERVKNNFAQERYESLRNIKVNPTYVLSNRDGLVQVSGRMEDKPQGKPLVETRVIASAYDPKTSKYGLKMSDGTIKEVSKEIYKTYGGSK